MIHKCFDYLCLKDNANILKTCKLFNDIINEYGIIIYKCIDLKFITNVEGSGQCHL